MKSLRLVLHVLVALIGWIVFGYLWIRALVHGVSHDLISSFAYMVLTSVAIIVSMTVWIVYNVGIYRRKGARTTVPPVDYDYSTDSLGRQVVLDPVSLRGVSIVVVTAQDGVKSYSAQTICCDAAAS